MFRGVSRALKSQKKPKTETVTLPVCSIIGVFLLKDTEDKPCIYSGKVAMRKQCKRLLIGDHHTVARTGNNTTIDTGRYIKELTEVACIGILLLTDR